MTWTALLFWGLVIVLCMLGLHRWQAATRARLEEEIQESYNQEKRRLILRLDHELKNPLTAIRVNLVNLFETEDPEAQRQIHQALNVQVLRLSQLVTDLRKLANLDSGVAEQLPVDTRALAGQLVEAVRKHPLAKQRQLVLPDEDDYKDLSPIVGDEDLLQLAVYNLIDNAMKFTKPGDAITSQIYEDNNTLVISIQDEGMGIPERDLPFVCEELYRSKAAHGIPGSGLGLAMVRTVMDLHGGAVEIESEIGEGTTVTLTLLLDQE